MCRMARPRKPLLSRDRIVAAAQRARGRRRAGRRLHPAARRGAGGQRAVALQPLPEQGRDPRRGRRRRRRAGRPVDVRRGRRTRLARRRCTTGPSPTGRRSPRTRTSCRCSPRDRAAARPGLRVADAVFGGMVGAGWPPAQATRIGALMRYFVAGLGARLVRPRLRRRRDGVRPGRLPAPRPGPPAGRAQPAGRRGRVRDRAEGAGGRAGAQFEQYGPPAWHGSGPRRTAPARSRDPWPVRPVDVRPRRGSPRWPPCSPTRPGPSFCLALLDGRAWTAGELARRTRGVAPSTASEHLGKLIGGRAARPRSARAATATCGSPTRASPQLVESLAAH